MTDKILELVKKHHNLNEKSVGEFKTFKANGMKFICSAYNAEGLGHVSVMRAKGFFGLMKMDTLVIAPIDTDLPLLSYDRIYAMGNDTLILELYDTMGEEKTDCSPLAGVKARYASLPDRDDAKANEAHWYDSIRLPETLAKKGKKKDSAEFDKLTLDYTEAFLKLDGKPCEKNEKIRRTDVYVDGLLNQGGPATDVFKKQFGYVKTSDILKIVLFGTK